jgi:hypothetical protein
VEGFGGEEGYAVFLKKGIEKIGVAIKKEDKDSCRLTV